MEAAFEHIPVLRREVLEYLTFPSDRPARLIDGTVGGGGHSALLLRRYPQLELLGIDRDENALAKAAETLAFAGNRVTLVRGDYSSLAGRAAEHGWEEVDGILLDIGVSSPQLDHAGRGFSWRAEGPLDMRMDQRSELTASRFLNRASEQELERVLRKYGEVDKSRRVAAAIVKKRETHPFATTADLVGLCDEVLGKSKPGKLPAPTLVFQALRIAVNDELGELERTLPAAEKLLKKGGRITPAAAALGTLLKIKPVLIILGEKLDSFAKARTMKQAKTMMMNAIQKELDGRLHDSECRNCHLAIAHTDNEEAALEFKKEVEERFPNADVYMAPLSLSIACHIGPGSLAVTATRKMEEEHEKN